MRPGRSNAAELEELRRRCTAMLRSTAPDDLDRRIARGRCDSTARRSAMNHPARPAVPTDRDRWVDLAIAATYALALALTLWPIQYALWLPVRYLTLITVAVVRFAVKLGAVGVLLLLLPVVGWIILAVWLVIRHQNALAERRHMQQLQAIEARDHRAHDYAETVATQTAPRSVWRPWLIDYVLEAAA